MVLTLNDAAKFRTALKDAIPDAQLARLNDADLLRFLEARRGDEALAKQMVVDYVEFRGKWKLDERPMDFIDGRTVLFPIRGYEPLVKDANMDLSNKTTRMWAKWLRHHGGGVWHKFDREGRPLVIELPGLHDAKGFLADCDPEELMEWHVRISEALTGPIMDFAAKKHGGDGQLTCIFDLSGLGMHQMHLPALNLLKSITDADQKYYPERLNKLFIINNPYVFTLIWRIFRPWLDKRVQEKIHVLGTNFKDTLLKHIDASSLPAKYGGNCTCSHMEGGCVPKLGPQGPTVFTEDVDEEMELVEGEPDFEYKTKSSHGQFHFNLEILPGMVQKDQATVSVAFIADVPLSFEAKDAVTGEVIYQGQFDEGNSTRKLAFNVTNTPANYNLIWNADGKDFGLEFGVDIKE